MREDKLIRIPLQFFGEPEDEEDFDDYYDDEDEDLDEDDADSEEESAEDAETDTEDGDVEEETDEGESGKEPEEDSEETDESEETNETDALIAELRAAGYVGDDIKSLTADVKKKNESAAAAERKAANSASKSHLKSGKPGKKASGDGMAGFSRRDIEEMKQAIGNGCTEERARRALEKRIRATAR